MRILIDIIKNGGMVDIDEIVAVVPYDCPKKYFNETERAYRIVITTGDVIIIDQAQYDEFRVSLDVAKCYLAHSKTN